MSRFCINVLLVGSFENYCNDHHNSTRITCVLRRARYAWWASRDRYYVDLSDFRQIRIITILGRPPGITCTSQHTRYAGGIVMIITIVHDGTHKRTYIHQRLTESRIQKIHYKDPITTEVNIIRLRIRIQLWNKSPEDKRRHHNPAQAKPLGFPS